jgi:hypothetical protein
MRSNNLASGLRTDALHVAAGKVCDTPRRRSLTPYLSTADLTEPY